jgi:(2S)-methylsuccinyl-CoA dehydrogenase
MPHDGQTIPDGTVILPDLLALPAPPWPRRRRFLHGDGTSAGRFERRWPHLRRAAGGQPDRRAWACLAGHLCRIAAPDARLGRAPERRGKFGEVEQLILQIGMGEYLWQIYGGIPMSQGEILRPQDIGLTQEDQRGLMTDAVMTLTGSGNTQAARTRLVELMQERSPRSPWATPVSTTSSR